MWLLYYQFYLKPLTYLQIWDIRINLIMDEIINEITTCTT